MTQTLVHGTVTCLGAFCSLQFRFPHPILASHAVNCLHTGEIFKNRIRFHYLPKTSSNRFPSLSQNLLWSSPPASFLLSCCELICLGLDLSSWPCLSPFRSLQVWLSLTCKSRLKAVSPVRLRHRATASPAFHSPCALLLTSISLSFHVFVCIPHQDTNPGTACLFLPPSSCWRLAPPCPKNIIGFMFSLIYLLMTQMRSCLYILFSPLPSFICNKWYSPYPDSFKHLHSSIKWSFHLSFNGSAPHDIFLLSPGFCKAKLILLLGEAGNQREKRGGGMKKML